MTSTQSFTATSSGTSRKAPLRHLDDLVAGHDIDPHTPLRKLLERASDCIRQAITLKSFGRPDLALREYIAASTLAVYDVPKHKDFPSLRSDRSDLGRVYSSLKANINQNAQAFEQIKELIIEDNKRTGVLPTKQSSAGFMNLPSAPSTQPRDTSNTQQTQSAPPTPPRSKPRVGPKPQALHGNSVRGVEDLASRFARLRDSEDTRPAGPRDMPVSSRSSVDTAVPRMPKLPEAIYSPARGTITSEVANLPSSTPRGMFSRTNSMVSAPSSSARTSMENAIRQYGSDQAVSGSAQSDISTAKLMPRVLLPEGPTITPQELQEYNKKMSILLLDIRDQPSFDEGHIISQRLVRVDPTILDREDVSAEAIADSMELDLHEEKERFERRHEYDAVVIYDQDSRSVPMTKKGLDHHAKRLFMLDQALRILSDKKLKNPPKLLLGGFNAWSDAFALGSTSSSRMRTKYLDQSQKDEIEAEIERGVPPKADLVRNTSDFLARYPSLSQMKDSMYSPVNPRRTHGRGYEAINYIQDAAMIPPTRPPPSAPKRSNTGFESHTEASDSRSPVRPRKRRRTGLENPGNWCYANSFIQALLASPGFGPELVNKEWPQNWRPQKLSRQRTPQLMSRILGNLFQWLSKREFDAMKAATLMKYVRSIHAGYSIEGLGTMHFGDNHQHDTEEFGSFILSQLGEETKKHATEDSVSSKGFDLQKYEVNQELQKRHLDDLWRDYCAQEDSVYWKYWGFIRSIAIRCSKCGWVGNRWDKSTILQSPLRLPDRQNGLISTLEESLDVYYGDEEIEFCCEKCKDSQQLKTRTTKMIWMPPLLELQLNRFSSDVGLGGPKKLKHGVKFPLRGLDLAPYKIQIPQVGTADSNPGIDWDTQCTKYDLYAVVGHQGDNANRGHYWTWVREGDSDSWTICEDQKIESFEDAGGKLERHFETCAGDFTPYVLFYKRQDVPWSQI